MIVVVYGPRGCGKSTHKQQLAAYNGCIHIHDCDEDGPTLAAVREMHGDHLILTTPDRADEMKRAYLRAPGGVRLVPYETAAKRAGIVA